MAPKSSSGEARKPGTWRTLAPDRSVPGKFWGPNDVVLDDQGNVYVAEVLNHRIQKLSPAGKPLAAWGTQGAGLGQFRYPLGWR
jgi:DNA-binding beta-propeller fold protein YncE